MLDCATLGKWVGGNIMYNLKAGPTIVLAPPASDCMEFQNIWPDSPTKVIDSQSGVVTSFLLLRLSQVTQSFKMVDGVLTASDTSEQNLKKQLWAAGFRPLSACDTAQKAALTPRPL